MLAGADPELALLIERVGPPSLERPALQSPFEALAGPSSTSSSPRRPPARSTGGCRPSSPAGRSPPAAVPGLRRRAPPRRRHVPRQGGRRQRPWRARTLEGVVPDLHTLQDMDDEAIIARLTRVRGVGRWTVEMFLLFRLGRPDVLPATDLGIRRGFMRTYRLDNLPEPPSHPRPRNPMATVPQRRQLVPVCAPSTGPHRSDDRQISTRNASSTRTDRAKAARRCTHRSTSARSTISTGECM
ncbi:MAG: hypothetical protein KatS3mg043_0934 [Rhodothermaceae bacterium]|nr:MAG: hypothetical protein KatS3mg043_0934 [Rhodothermaceae bacterium]